MTEEDKNLYELTEQCSNITEFIDGLFGLSSVPIIEINDTCRDCGEKVAILIYKDEQEGLELNDKYGLYFINGNFHAKCPACFEVDPVLKNYQPCEVWSRVVGYMRPVKQWNAGKKAEWELRKTFKVEG